MSKVWTAICYNWQAAKTSRIVFTASHDGDTAREEFESMHPAEDLVALVPGSHEWTLTYPLTRWLGRARLSRPLNKKLMISISYMTKKVRSICAEDMSVWYNINVKRLSR